MKQLITIILFLSLCANVFTQDLEYDHDRYNRMSFWTKLKVENVELINTANEEFSPYIWSDYLIYISPQAKEGIFKNNQPNYFDLKASLLNPESTLSQFVFTNELNSKFHEGPVSWDQSSNRLYFTRAASIDQQPVVDQEGRQQLNIYQADYAQGKWSNIVPLNFNLENETYCHPAIFDGGNKIIFASPMPGGKGKMDLYLSEKKDENSWSTPKNLGEQINHSGNQWFPFVSSDRHLFYASDVGDGQGLDIYYANVDEEGNILSTQRLPFPINTSYDDFGLVFSEDGTSGYFSSNRSEGKGKDDVYAVKF